MPVISNLHAREIIDSRGQPTIEVDLAFGGGGKGVSQVESGTSIGSYEMHELRDGDLGRLNGQGVKRVVENINNYLAPELKKAEYTTQRMFDQYVVGLDGTPSLERYGANGILGVSLAFAQAMADRDKTPLFQYFGTGKKLPIPMFTIFNGGKLASFSTDAQEFNIFIKDTPSFSEALRIGTEIYHSVGQGLKDQGFDKKLGDEGGYAVPNATTDQGMQLIVEGVERAGFTRDSIGIVLDVAATNLFTNAQLYHLAHHDGDVPAEYLIQKFEKLSTNFPLAGVEDGLADQDWNSWTELNRRLGDKIMIIGDDIFSTNAVRLEKGYTDKIANSIMIKPTQIGTLTGAIDAIDSAVKLGLIPILSHRSGDTENSYLAHFAVGLGVPYVKFGAPARGERTAKYNELLRIEEMLKETTPVENKDN